MVVVVVVVFVGGGYYTPQEESMMGSGEFFCLWSPLSLSCWDVRKPCQVSRYPGIQWQGGETGDAEGV